MKRLIIFLLLFAAIKVAGQTTGYLRFDTVKIMKQNGTCELYIINATKDSLGLLTNVGGGLTQFRKSRVLNDSTIVVGLDTLVIVGGVGGGGGSGSVASISQGYGIVNTPNPITSTGTIRADTSGTNGLVTRTELLDSTDITTQVESPIYVKLRSSWPVADTLALRRGYGLDTSSTGELRVDTFNISTRAWRQKLADSLGALITAGGGINQLTGQVTAGPGTGSQVATIATNTVSNANLRQSAARSVIGRASNSTGNVADITSSTANRALTDNGTSLDWRQIDLTNTVTGELPENNLQAFRPFPAERQWRTLYEKSSWADLADFSTSGTAVISLSTGYVNVTASTQDYTPRVYFKPEWATGLNYWKTTTRVKIIAFGSPSNWMGPFIKSLVNHDGANFGYQFFTSVTSAGTGNSFFTTENGTIISNPGAGSGVTKSLNDVLEFVMERADTTLTFTLRNITTSTTATPITYTFPANNTPNILPNVGQWGVLLNAASGTFQIQYVKIESSETVAPNVLVMGNSKTANGATTFNRRFPSQLNATYPTVTWSAGTAERMEPDMFYKRPELTFRNPEYVILASVYDNDKRAGFTNADIIDDMIRLENYWIGGGATVLWMCLPEDSTAGGASGLTGIRNWLVSARPNNYINTWDSLRTSGSDNRLADIYDNGDGVHLNAAAHDKIVQTIIASGKVSTISPQRRVHIRSDDPNMRVIGDSVGLAFDWSRTAGNLPRVNSSWNVTSSNIWQNESGNVTIASTINPTPVLSNGLFNVQGVFSLSGSANSQRQYDRTTPANFFESVINSNTKYISYNGVDRQYIGTDGQMRFGNGSSVSSSIMQGMVQIKANRTFTGTQGRIGVGLNVDTMSSSMPNTGHSFFVGNSIGPHTITSTSSGNTITAANFYIDDSVVAGTNHAITGTSYALYINKGKTRLGTTDSAGTATGGFLFKDFTTGDVRLTAAPGGGVTQSALDDTAAAIRSAIPSLNYEMFYSDNSSTTVGNTTTEATLLGTGTGTAQFTGATAGCVLSLKGNGILSTAASAGTPILEFTVGNYILGMNLTGLTGSLTNVFYDYDFEIIPVAIGTNQDAIVHCKVYVEDGASGKTYSYSTRVSASFTSSGTLSVDVTADWDAADVANTLTSYKNIVQIFRK